MSASVLVAAANTAAPPYTTPSFTTSDGSLLVVVVGTTGGASATGVGSTDAISSTLTGLGAWGLKQQSNPGSSGQTAMYVFHAYVTTGSTGTVTVGAPAIGSTPADMTISVLEVPGVDPDIQVTGFVGAAGTATSFSLTLTEAPLAADTVMGFAVSRNSHGDVTPGSGFTELVDFEHPNPAASQFAEYKTSTTSTDVSMSGLNSVHSSAVGFVVKAPDGTTPPPDVYDTYVWDGSSLIAADVFVWDGTNLIPATVDGTAT